MPRSVFISLKGEKADKCIYVPRTPKTDKMFRKYCAKYLEKVNERKGHNVSSPVPVIIGRSGVINIIGIILFLAVVVALSVGEIITVWAALICIPFLLCSTVIVGLRKPLAGFLRNRYIKSLDKLS